MCSGNVATGISSHSTIYEIAVETGLTQIGYFSQNA